MINIEKFVQIRKDQKLSQTDLCHGICTQSTLSKFENNGQVPSFKILKQLCDRLNIEVGDIMTSSDEKKVARLLFEADFSFINFDYAKILNILSQINPQNLKRDEDKVHYHFLRGQYALKSDRNQMSALFYFNNILTTDNLPKNDIYRLLALNGCSQIYAKQGETEKAQHYYDQILKSIMDYYQCFNHDAHLGYLMRCRWILRRTQDVQRIEFLASLRLQDWDRATRYLLYGPHPFAPRHKRYGTG